MKEQSMTIKVISLLLSVSVFLSSCGSTTLIQSNPSGAKVYLNGEPVGTTPYTHSDTKIVGTKTKVKLEKEGFEDLNTSFSRNEEVDVGAIIGGVFLLVPFLWTMKYKPSHFYELTPVPIEIKKITRHTKEGVITSEKASKLRKLKELLREKLITEEEYKIEKQKVLEAE